MKRTPRVKATHARSKYRKPSTGHPWTLKQGCAATAKLQNEIFCKFIGELTKIFQNNFRGYDTYCALVFLRNFVDCLTISIKEYTD